MITVNSNKFVVQLHVHNLLHIYIKEEWGGNGQFYLIQQKALLMIISLIS